MTLLLLTPALAAGLPTEAEVFAGALARFDGDKNGAISETEYLRFDTAAGFASMDLDASGAVDLAEFTAWVKVTQPRPARVPDAGGGGGAGAPADGILVQVVDTARRLAAPAGAVLSLRIGGGDAALLNDRGEGVDITAGDNVWAGLAPRPAKGPLAVELAEGARTWAGEASFDAATATSSAPLTVATDGSLVAFRGAVPIGGRAGAGGPVAARPAGSKGTNGQGAGGGAGDGTQGGAAGSATGGAAGSAAGGGTEGAAEGGNGLRATLPAGWPWFVGILGAGVLVGGWIEWSGRRRRRRGRGGRR